MIVGLWVAIGTLVACGLICAFRIDSLNEDVSGLKRVRETLDGYDTDMRDRVRLVEQRLDRLEDWASADVSLELDDDTN